MDEADRYTLHAYVVSEEASFEILSEQPYRVGKEG
jgi:hypothetical protein